MHLNRFTNAVFFDGHGGSLQRAPKDLPDVDKYAIWLRRYGVQDPEFEKTQPLN